MSVKLARPAPASDLYCSPWFRLVRAVVEHEPWAILSARHGLVWPQTVIEPYDETLRGKTSGERRVWAARVLATVPSADRYVIWAGRLYAEHLAGALRAELPLRGIGIGQQLAYLKRTHARPSFERRTKGVIDACFETTDHVRVPRMRVARGSG